MEFHLQSDIWIFFETLQLNGTFQSYTSLRFIAEIPMPGNDRIALHFALHLCVAHGDIVQFIHMTR